MPPLLSNAPAAKKLSVCLLAFVCFTVTTNSVLTTATQTYVVHMDRAKIAALDHSLGGAKRWHEAIIDSLLELSSYHEAQESTPPQLLYVYNTSLTGFAVKLSNSQLQSLRKINGFLDAYPDEMFSLHTTYSPHFLGLEPGRGLWSQSNLASDIIIGIIDTGIWPEHISFSDAHFSELPRQWKGACEKGTMFTSKNCNKKIIGARAFWKGYEAAGGKINDTTDFRSARDSEGHGTHTASTAGGNLVAGASLFGNAMGLASGMQYTARIAAYKACWSAGCVSSDILAAVDTAVADGVDVLSLSLGGGSRPYYMDGIAIAAFGATQKGVFVSCSAGNSGPSESTVSNTAPWIMTVAASYMDRRFPTSIKLGDGRTITGASLYSGRPTGLLPLVYANTAGDIPSARYCTEGSLSQKLVKGKMVLCDRGINGRTKKGEVVKLAGGAGMIIANSAEQGEELFADPHVLPASSLGASATTAIKGYITSAKNPTAMITFQGTVYGEPAPMVTAFSSRGPSTVGPDLIKPDVAAPGMSILAAWPPSPSPSLLPSDRRTTTFNIISGTSMSCPHVSGLAALLKSAHRDWSPAAVKSALMTTAHTTNNRNTLIIDVSSALPATPFSIGSGHVDPEKASNPGLVYDIAPTDYLNYLCSLNYTSQQLLIVSRENYECPKDRVLEAGDLNYPSFSVQFDRWSRNSTVTQTRTVTNVGLAKCEYEVKVKEPEGVSVRVDPEVLAFSEVGQKLSYSVSFAEGGGSGYAFGELVWVCGEFYVRSPIAVTWQQARRH